MTGSLNPPIPVIGEPNSLEDPVTKESLEYLRDKLNSILASDNTVDPSLFNASNKIKFKWYEPKIIGFEESRESTSFGYLTTEDKISNVIVNENALVLVGYRAKTKTSVESAGGAAFFAGVNRIANAEGGKPEAALGSTTTFRNVWNEGIQISDHGESIPDITTGQALNALGLTPVFLGAGTYEIGVRFKATSGNIKVKERKLYVATLG